MAACARLTLELCFVVAVYFIRVSDTAERYLWAITWSLKFMYPEDEWTECAVNSVFRFITLGSFAYTLTKAH